MTSHYYNVISLEIRSLFNVETAFKKLFKFVVVRVPGISFLFHARKWLDEDGTFSHALTRKAN